MTDNDMTISTAALGSTMDFMDPKGLRVKADAKYLKKAPKTYLRHNHSNVKNSKVAAQIDKMHRKWLDAHPELHSSEGTNDK